MCLYCISEAAAVATTTKVTVNTQVVSNAGIPGVPDLTGFDVAEDSHSSAV